MTPKDIIGIAFVIVGVPVMALGWRVLGATWAVIGMVAFFIGLWLIIDSAREKRLREMMRGGGPGDYGDRHYISGESASFSDHGGGGGGGGGDA